MRGANDGLTRVELSRATGAARLVVFESGTVALEGAVVVRPMMYLALSYDHRIIDGSDAVSFLVAIKEVLEDPARLLLEV